MNTRGSGGVPDIEQIRKQYVFGVGISLTDYRQATAAIISAARQRRSYTVTALATHGLMLAAEDESFRGIINSIDLVTPDGQPVRWALNSLHNARLGDRVYGPDLTGFVCAAAEREGVSVYLFGSSPRTANRFAGVLKSTYPRLTVAGVQPDRFREATPEEDVADIELINASGAGIVLVGRGCPRQERWVATHKGRVHGAMLAVGAAFDYHAGVLRRPPRWAQRVGLEWLFRLAQEPRRLFARYLYYNSLFLMRFGSELTRKGRKHGRHKE